MAAAGTLVCSANGIAKAKPADFTDFAGTYDGTLSVNLTFETFTTPVTLVFKSKARGAVGVATITGVAEGYPFSTVYTFGKKGKVTVTGLLPGNQNPTTGTYKFKPGKVKSTASAIGSNPPFPASVTSTLKLKGDMLKLNGTLNQQIDPTLVQTGTLAITVKKKK